MSNPSPTITFRVNLTLPMKEAFGPNSDEYGVNHPDRFQPDQDQAVTDISNRKNYRSVWLPGLGGTSNRALKHGDTFTAYGMNAIYIKNTYTTGLNPILTVVE